MSDAAPRPPRPGATAPPRDRLSQYYGATYGDRSGDKLSASARLKARLFHDWTGRGKRVLDVGCGSGSLTRFLTEGNQVTGIDVDERALQACAADYGIKTVWADFGAALPFDPASFDVVVASETIEHLPYPRLLLAEIARVLAPGGLCLGSVPNEYSLQNRVRVLRGRPISRDPTHLHHFSLAALRALLGDYFRVDEIVPVRGKWRRLSPSLWAHSFAWRAHRPPRVD